MVLANVNLVFCPALVPQELVDDVMHFPCENPRDVLRVLSDKLHCLCQGLLPGILDLGLVGRYRLLHDMVELLLDLLLTLEGLNHGLVLVLDVLAYAEKCKTLFTTAVYQLVSDHGLMLLHFLSVLLKTAPKIAYAH